MFDNNHHLIEYVDLSDDGNINLTNLPVPISTAHSKSLRHRGTWAFIVNSAKDCLLFTYRSADHVTCGNSYGLIGEHTKWGESYENAILRGVNEELLVNESSISHIEALQDGIPERLYIKYKNIKKIDNQWILTFLIVLKDGVEIPCQTDECGGYKWVKIREVDKWLSSHEKNPKTGEKIWHYCNEEITSYPRDKNALPSNFVSFRELIMEKVVILQKRLNLLLVR